MKVESGLCEKRAELLWDSKNTMSMGGINEFKRHSSRTANGIKITTRSTKTTFATKRDDFKFTTMLTAIKCIAIFIITTV